MRDAITEAAEALANERGGAIESIEREILKAAKEREKPAWLKIAPIRYVGRGPRLNRNDV